jgi:hypothetical protein
VLSELRRGGRTRATERIVAKLHTLARDPWTPHQNDWWVLAASFERSAAHRIGIAIGAGFAKRRPHRVDGETARSASNREHFELHGRKRRVRILAV